MGKHFIRDWARCLANDENGDGESCRSLLQCWISCRGSRASTATLGYSPALATGAPVTYKTTRDLFAAACEVAGLADVRLHDLRRTVATSLAASGTNAYTL